ncbi:hypothetical protein BZA77DRAFT_344304 [Pyronema omphalodes]|nr:hypothetical protein BZA77DRAFT_344304 [Pyronema omphalodes]
MMRQSSQFFFRSLSGWFSFFELHPSDTKNQAISTANGTDKSSSSSVAIVNSGGGAQINVNTPPDKTSEEAHKAKNDKKKQTDIIIGAVPVIRRALESDDGGRSGESKGPKGREGRRAQGVKKTVRQSVTKEHNKISSMDGRLTDEATKSSKLQTPKSNNNKERGSKGTQSSKKLEHSHDYQLAVLARINL